MQRVTGHFGEFLQGRLGADGPLALVTVPCADLGVSVRRTCAAGTLTVEAGAPPCTGAEAAGRLLAALGLPARGAYELRAEMPPGGGAGASTAALLALATAAGVSRGAGRLAKACLVAEGAVDPLMLRHPARHLWASRAARSLRRLPPLPSLEILGGFLGPPQRTDPSDEAFPDISDLVPAWIAAARDGDVAALARLASLSAERCTAMRGPSGDPTGALAAELGALGHLRAHTGSARGLIFAPGRVPDGAEARLRRAGLGQVLRFVTGWAGR